jgi:hypothetical protein
MRSKRPYKLRFDSRIGAVSIDAPTSWVTFKFKNQEFTDLSNWIGRYRARVLEANVSRVLTLDISTAEVDRQERKTSMSRIERAAHELQAALAAIPHHDRMAIGFELIGRAQSQRGVRELELELEALERYASRACALPNRGRVPDERARTLAVAYCWTMPPSPLSESSLKAIDLALKAIRSSADPKTVIQAAQAQIRRERIESALSSGNEA